LRGSEPVSAEELQRARACLRSERVMRDETVEARARVIGHGLRTQQGLVFDDVYMAQIEHAPLANVADAVERWLLPEQAVIVALVPNGSVLKEDELIAAWARGVEVGARTTAEPQKRRAEALRGARPARPAAEVVDLRPGIRMVYRQDAESKLVTVVGGTEGGLRGETLADAGIYNAMASMLGLASRRRTYEQTVGLVEERGASLDGFSGKDSLGVSIQALAEHSDELLELMAECLLEPSFPEEQWASTQRELQQSLKAMGDSPARTCILAWHDALLGDHPYRFPALGTPASVERFTVSSLRQRFDAERDGGPWVFAATGPGTAESMAASLARVFARFTPRAAPRLFASAGVTYPRRRQSLRFAKDREQSHLVYGYLGIAWDDPQRAALDVLVNVLGGHGGRLFRKLRDQESLAYSVSPIVSYGTHRGLVGSYIACAPAKEKQALAALEAEMLALTREPPRAEELDRARNFIVGTHEMGLQRSDARASTMALMELYGYGYDDYLRYPQAVARVTADEVLAVAQRVFVAGEAVDVTVGPG
jgi:zinc protease